MKTKRKLINELAAEVNMKRAYNPYETPQYLVFEYKWKNLLREGNVKVLSSLLESASNPRGFKGTIFPSYNGSRQISGCIASSMLVPYEWKKFGNGNHAEVFIRYCLQEFKRPFAKI